MTIKIIQAESLAKLETAVNAYTPAEGYEVKSYQFVYNAGTLPAAFLLIGAIPEPEPEPDPEPDPDPDPDPDPEPTPDPEDPNAEPTEP